MGERDDHSHAGKQHGALGDTLNADPAFANTAASTDDLPDDQPSTTPAGASARPADTIGRFQVIKQLGAGGMGVVYAARDPVLERHVALKLLRPETAGIGGEARLRMLREAQAMAQLQHAHVVTVYDVGLLEEQVFIAMELIDGKTLREWSGERHPWREVRDVFTAAGEGLLAAHRAGLVHRDFKPDNVLIGADGRPRVTDFGLASVRTVVASASDLEAEDTLDSALPIPLDATLTQTGAVLGTPLYMAPEQHLGQRADARSDQFAFCAALFEALYRRPPFGGSTYEEIKSTVLAGKLAAPPSDTEVPAFLYDLLARGLRTDPDQRFSSMEQLLRELRHDPEAEGRRRRRTMALAAMATLTTGAITYAILGSTSGAPAVCSGGDRVITKTWSLDAKTAVGTEFAETGSPHAQETARRVNEMLDDYAGKWAAMYRESCEATHRGEQSDAMLDRQMVCLDRRLRTFDAVVELFITQPDTQIVDRAVTAVSSLPDVADCGDLSRMNEAFPAPPPATAGEVERSEQLIARAQALKAAGKYSGALPIARQALDRARATDYPPVIARARLLLGEVELRAGSIEAGRATLEAAVHEAVTARDDAIATEAWIALIGALGDDEARVDEALALATAARAAAQRSGNEHQRAALQSAIADVLMRKGDYEQALALYEDTAETLMRLHGERDADVAGAVHNLGAACDRLGRLDEAKAHYERAIELSTAALGADHPETATSISARALTSLQLGDLEEAESGFRKALAIQEAAWGADNVQITTALDGLGTTLRSRQNYDEALEIYSRSLELREQALGADHPDVADSLQYLGNLHNVQGNYELAGPFYERALAILSGRFAPDHPEVAAPLTNLAIVRQLEGRNAEAKRLLLRALAIWEKQYGDEHPRIAITLFNLGQLSNELEEYADAAADCRRALAIDEAILGEDNPDLGYDLTCLGIAEIGRNRPSAAIEYLERALSLRSADSVQPADRANTEFALARALWKAGRQRNRAIRLARRALATYAKVAPEEADHRAVQRWLAERQR